MGQSKWIFLALIIFLVLIALSVLRTKYAWTNSDSEINPKVGSPARKFKEAAEQEGNSMPKINPKVEAPTSKAEENKTEEIDEYYITLANYHCSYDGRGFVALWFYGKNGNNDLALILFHMTSIRKRHDGNDYTSVILGQREPKGGCVYESATILVPSDQDKDIWLAKIEEYQHRHEQYLIERGKPQRVLPQ